MNFIGNLMKILLGIFLVSNITAFYIKITIICAPIYIIMLSIHFKKFLNSI